MRRVAWQKLICPKGQVVIFRFVPIGIFNCECPGLDRSLENCRPAPEDNFWNNPEGFQEEFPTEHWSVNGLFTHLFKIYTTITWGGRGDNYDSSGTMHA